MTATNPPVRAYKRVRVKRDAPMTPPKGRAGLAQMWRVQFLAKLAETSNVRSACEHAGVTPGTVYDLKRRDTEFADRWNEALCEGYDNLEMEMLHHLRTGETQEPGGRKFNFAVALRMLIAHRETVGREKARRAHVTVQEVRASIDRKVAELRDRVLARCAQEDEASGPDDAD